jgi:6-phosphogluconolactonase (cycloisomerase 2 family)
MGSSSFEGSAGGLILAGQSPDNLGRGNRYLFATNTGSNEISVFVVQQGGLTLVDKVPSGGMQPVSLTLRKNVLYVLNQASGNINGFILGEQGTLTPIPGSTRPVTGGGPADTAQVSFTPGGDVLVVTGKNTNIIDTYTVGADRVAHGPIPNQATGVTPFGFAFTQRGQVIVAESFQGAMGQGAASSYEVPSTGVLVPISGPVRNERSDTCWVVITDNNKYAYVANAQSGDVSSYRVAPDGTLILLAPIAGTTGPLTIDEALSQDSRYLYVRVLSDGSIRVFQVQEDGSLTPLQTIGGLPPGAIGLAAR